MTLALLALAALVSSLVVVAIVRAGARLPQAMPNARSLHTKPVPRVGGIAIWSGVAAFLIALPPRFAPGAMWTSALAAVVVVSLVEDWIGVARWARLVCHVLVASAAAVAIFGIPGSGARELGVFAAATLTIAWASNLYNFMDGSDGLAAAMAIGGFSALGIAAIGADDDAMFAFAIVAATLPVFVANAPPARVFLGDVGAVPLGFVAASAGLAGVRLGLWPGWFPLLVFLPFVLDASVTLVRRALRRERILDAHRSHYYQRLVRMGAGHGGTLAVYGLLMLGTGSSALYARAAAPEAGVYALAAWCALLGAFFAAIDYHWRRVPDPSP